MLIHHFLPRTLPMGRGGSFVEIFNFVDSVKVDKVVSARKVDVELSTKNTCNIRRKLTTMKRYLNISN